MQRFREVACAEKPRRKSPDTLSENKHSVLQGIEETRLSHREKGSSGRRIAHSNILGELCLRLLAVGIRNEKKKKGCQGNRKGGRERKKDGNKLPD